MRKSDPAIVRAEFDSEMTRLSDHFQRVLDAITGSAHQMADASRLAESVFVSAYVSFEGFVSNLFIAYLNRDPTAFQHSVDTRMLQSLQQKFGPWHSARTSFATLSHVNVDAIRDILDPDQKNLTFGSTAKMKERAAEILVPEYRDRIQALTDHDARVLDTARATRNYISHRSDSAYRDMNARLSTVDAGPPNSELGRGAHAVLAVGSFLKAETNTDRRVILYVRRLQNIAAIM